MHASVRLLVTLASLVIIAGTATSWSARSRTVEDVRAQFSGPVARAAPDLLAATRKEPDAWRARLYAAKGLLVEAMDPGTLESAATEGLKGDLDRRLANIAAARDVAREHIVRAPSSSDAWLILGAATYLERSLRRDDELITRFRDWEAPLEAALELAPSFDDASRFLAAAYLETWRFLSAEKREVARTVLRTALRDPTTLDRLLPAWVATASSVDEAAALVPRDARSFGRLLAELEKRNSWRAYADLYEEWRGIAIAQFADEREALAPRRAREARQLLQRAAQSLPLESAGLLSLRETARLVPPGPLPLSPQDAQRWLIVGLEACLTSTCEEGADFFGRLALSASDAPAALLARAALASGDVHLAERYESTEGVTTATDWALYWVQKARWSFARGDRDAAMQAMRRASGAAAVQLLEPLRRQMGLPTHGSRPGWRLLEPRHYVTHVDRPPGPSWLEIEAREVPRRGAVVGVRIDEGPTVAVPLFADHDDRVVTLQLPPTEGSDRGSVAVHWRTLAGPLVVPGAVVDVGDELQ